jgi:hypothetical protein
MSAISFAIGIVGHPIEDEQELTQCLNLANQIVSELIAQLDFCNKNLGTQAQIPVVIYGVEKQVVGALFIKAVLAAIGMRAQVIEVENSETGVSQLCAQSNIVIAILKPEETNLVHFDFTLRCIRSRSLSATQTLLGEPLLAGPITVIKLPARKSAEVLNPQIQDLVCYLEQCNFVLSCTEKGHLDTTQLALHFGWINSIGRVSTRVLKYADNQRLNSNEQAPVSLAQLFTAADTVASDLQNSVRNKTNRLIWSSIFIAVTLIFTGNFFPKIPVNYIAPVITILLAFVWTKFRKDEEFETFRFARAWAESLRIELALSRLGYKKRCVDLLHFRIGPTSTILRELMRCIRRTTHNKPINQHANDYKNCAGWLDGQIDYYESSAKARKKSFVSREKFRLIGLTVTGCLLVVIHIGLQTFAWWASIKLPPLIGILLLTVSVCAFSIAFIFGLFTQQLQLLEQSDSYERMLKILQMGQQAMKTEKPNDLLASQMDNNLSVDWVFAQALNEQEEWCLRQSGNVV